MPNMEPRLGLHNARDEHYVPRSPNANRGFEYAVMGTNQVHDALCAPAVQRFGQFEVANSVIAAHYVSGHSVLSFPGKGAQFLVLGDLMGKGLPAIVLILS